MRLGRSYGRERVNTLRVAGTTAPWPTFAGWLVSLLFVSTISASIHHHVMCIEAAA